MTSIVPATIPTKKRLKELVEAGEHIEFPNPTPMGWGRYVINSPVEPHHYYIPPNAKGIKSVEAGTSIFCTNHPKRSWFAQVTFDGSKWRVK